jgi:EAL domain-containing protein (putative c-di-GMP-specific phosphodiesterase class I)
MDSAMNKRIVFLGILLSGLVLFLFTVQIRFGTTLDEASAVETQYIARQTIASDLVDRITQIEALAYKIPLTASNERVLQQQQETFHNKLETIRDLIRLLERGGQYTRSVPLNIAEKEVFVRSFDLHKPEHAPIEVVRLKPQIEHINSIVEQLGELTRAKLNAVEYGRPVREISNRMMLLTKSIHSIFRRMKENANRLYFIAHEELTRQSALIKDRKIRYNFITFAGVFLLFVLLGMIAKYFIQELRDKIYIDRLTGLGTRRKLEETSMNKDALLILIDLDDFSDINSLYGMEYGNKILRMQADKLRTFDARAKTYRVAGDVFGLLYYAFPDDDAAVMERINALREHLKDCSRCKVDVSVTIAAARGEECLHDAYTALDIANAKGEPAWIYHDEGDYMREVQFNRLWHDELRSALEHDAIVPFFQPIVDRDRNVIHYETLMRLKRSNGKTEYISPSIFLDVAKKTKLYLPISRRLIEKAFAFFSDKPDVSFTINLSYEDMEREQMREFLDEMILKHHAKGRVVFEVLETSLIDNPIVIEEFIAHFRQMGVKIAIDDFGDGYSNLRRVVALNPDYLKIDGSLIQAMLRDRRSHKMVENIVEYAREFHIKTVAEFVSTPEIFNECKRLNMDYCQGYYFAEPGPTIISRLD